MEVVNRLKTCLIRTLTHYLGGAQRRQPPLHRSGQADAERVRGELQREVPRRVPEPALVRES